ncbi:MAG: helix-turn-helix domain-containing protein [Ardenticatenia bacterium]|nr:helix-turn-helix domain-containing protein [Ardenticatenia bacterium]
MGPHTAKRLHPDIEHHSCPIARTAELVGDTWTLLIIRDLMDGPRRFSELLASLSGISPKTLSRRLKYLEGQGIIERHVYSEIPPRVEYTLTPKGEALLPLIEDMRRYGEEWLK